MRVPLDWLAQYCDPGLDVRAIAERLAMTGTEVDRIHHHGVANLESFVVGRVLETAQHPDADRLTVCRVQIGAGEETQIVCGAPNVAAGQTVAIARPGAIMPDGTKLKKAKLRGVCSDGMILAEDELAISTAHDETIVLQEDGLVAGTAARRRAADRDRRARARDHAQPPRLPRRLRRRARAARGDRRGARARRRGRTTPRFARTSPPPAPPAEVVVEATRPVPALHRARLRGRDDRAVAAVAEGAPDGRRPAPDQQRRRHHELRHAR